MQKTSIWGFFLRNWRFTYLLIAISFLAGMVSVFTIPKESAPDIDIPVAFVSIALPGASAIDVEEFIVQPLEDQILGMEDVEEVNGGAERGVGSVTVQFDINADKQTVINNLKDRVDLAKRNLPDDATDPIVQSINFSDVPILTVALSGPFPVSELRYMAQNLSDDLKRVAGVSEVKVLGGEDREWQVVINKASLDGYGLSLRQVVDAIQLANTDIPIGTIRVAQENFTLRFDGGLSSVEDIANVPITARGTTPIFVRDVASIVDGYVQASSLARLSVNGKETEPSVSLEVHKVSGGNIIKTVDLVWEEINKAKTDLPQEVVFETIQNSAKQINDDLNNLLINGGETVIIVMLLLLIFLGWREALLAGISIPLTFLITFAVLKPLGYTLNFLSLFSLILSLGIIVDGAIVMMEGIHNEQKAGLSGYEATKRTIEQFAAPLIAGVMTTILAFLPMMLTSGIIGKFIESIPVTVSIVLLASLVVALALLPAMASRILKTKDTSKPLSKADLQRERLISNLANWYRGKLVPMLSSKKKQNRLLGLLGILLVFSLALPATGLLEVSMFTNSNQPTFSIDIEEPFGTPLDVTDDSLRSIEEVLLNDSRLSSFLVRVGSGSGDEHTANITVKIKEDAKISSLTLVDEFSAKLPALTDAKVSVTQAEEGPGSAAPVEVRIIGAEFEPMQELSDKVQLSLEKISGTKDIETNLTETNGEFVLTVDRVKARLFGVSALEVASTLRGAIYGSKAVTIRANGDDVNVMVKYDLDPFNPTDPAKPASLTASSIESLTIASPAGEIPLSSLATMSYSGGLARVEHLDGDRIIRVTSNVTSETSAANVFKALQKEVDTWEIPTGYSIEMGGQNEDIQKSFTDMLMAMALGVFLIAALLVWQFTSYRQPLFILATIPLALIGVLPGLTLVRVPLSFPALVGVVALTGIVVNNAIILIDRMNQNRRDGSDISQAVQEAAESRLQPILLTTVTTVAGLLPLAISSPTWGPLGYSIVFGLMMSTILTLLVVPILYLRFAEKEIETL